MQELKSAFRRLFIGSSRCLFLVVWINSMLFFFIGLFLGGSALSGKIEDGHFYLVSNLGELTEVSEAAWNYSYYHTISVCITGPAALGSFFLANKLDEAEIEYLLERSANEKKRSTN